MSTLLLLPRAPPAASPTILRDASHNAAAAVVAEHGRRRRAPAWAPYSPARCQTRAADARVSPLVNVQHWRPRTLGLTKMAPADGRGVVETQGTRHAGRGEGGRRSIEVYIGEDKKSLR